MKFLRTVLFSALLLLAPAAASAATLSIAPGTTSVHQGDIVTVRLVTNTQGVAINQGEGTLQFPADLLDVVSASKAGSIFTLWVEEPGYSNVAGTVHFDGGVPTPGYTGAAGTVLTVTFHAKKAGTATLSMTDAALRANDGLGTDVLTGSTGGLITVSAAAPTAPAATPATPSTPAATTGTKPATSNGAILNLTSTTHNDQNAWYQDNNPLISWQLPAGATEVETVLSTSSSAIPTVDYKPAIVEKRVTELADGISYFNIRAKVAGAWGPVASYKLQIDSKPPVLSSDILLDYDAAHQALIISRVTATDATSGIDHYELAVDGGEAAVIPAEEFASGSYSYHYAKAGIHSLVLRAVDAAGNHAEASGTFNIPTPLADQTLWTVGGIDISFGWFVIVILIISALSLAAALTAWYKLFMLRNGAKSRIDKRDKLLHRSLRIYKEELERHLRALERAGIKRELTDEEAELNEDLKKNVDDLERYLATEFKKFD